MSIRNFIVAITIFSSCTTAKITMQEDFSSQATKMEVSGLNGWMTNQKLNFGPYQTSKVKRGWDFSSSVQYTKFSIKPEEMLLKVLHVDTDKKSLSQRNNFQYTLQAGNLMSEIYATEKFTEKQLVYKSNNPYLGNASKTNRYEYSFTAAIMPLSLKDNEPWSLVLINRYDAAKDTARGIFDHPYVEEEGYATNGKENIAIRPLRVESVTTKSGKQTRLLGGKMLSGYEIHWNGEVVSVVDILDNSIWLKNNVEPANKLIISSVASAILLKRMQDVQKEKDQLLN